MDDSGAADDAHATEAATGQGLMADLLERERRARRRAERAAERLNRLHAVSAALSGALSYEQVADVIVTEAVAALGATVGVVSLLSGDGTTFTNLRVVGYSQDVIDAWKQYPADLAIPITDAVREKAPVILETYAERAVRYPHLKRVSSAGGDGASVGLPLLVEDHPIGGIGLGFATDRTFDEEALAFMRTVAHQCAQALERARLYEAERQARARAEANDRHFRELAELIPQVVWTALPDGSVDYHNERWFDLTGRNLQASQGWDWQDALHPDDRIPTLERWRRSVETGELYEIEHRIKLAGTEGYRWRLVRAVPLRDEHGQIVRWFGTSTDVDDQKRARDELRRLAEENARLFGEAREAVRVRDEFLASASHDLRSPLTALTAYTQLLGRRVARANLPAALGIVDSLEQIEVAARRMGKLLDELVDVTRLEIGHPLDLRRVQVDLVSMLREAADAHQQSSERHQIRLQTSEASLVGEWDAGRLQRVLDNLLSNAVKYSPGGGEVCVTLERRGDKGSGEAVLRVHDGGVGIPERELPRIFERYYRASNASEVPGVGLGLYGARQIVEQHGGTLTVESTEGSGSTFTVQLPLAGDDQEDG